MKNGFSLLEMMVTLSIAAILTVSSIIIYSVPTHQAKQNTAKLDLINFSYALEEYFSEYHTYRGVSIDKLFYTPITKEYKFRVVMATDDGYRIAAFPLKNFLEDECGVFSLDQEGNKWVSGRGSIDRCW